MAQPADEATADPEFRDVDAARPGPYHAPRRQGAADDGFRHESCTRARRRGI